MATATTLPSVQRQSRLRQIASTAAASSTAAIAGATAIAFLLLGYHPYAEDGGIYAAALAARLNPSLFPAERAFAVAHTGRSLFVPLLALPCRVLHVPLSLLLLAAYVACLAATIAAARTLAKVLFPSADARRWAVATLVIALGVPVAGTSLYLADPYLTARSLSTPLLLWALALLLRRRTARFAACLVIAFALHPMMAATAALLFLFVLALRSRHCPLWTCLLACGVLGMMAVVRFVPAAGGDAVRAASVSRSYWFPSQWAWYETIGLIAPLLLLPAMARMRGSAKQITPQARQIAMAATISSAVVCAGMLLFVHPGNASMLLARLQPLRLLHTVYLVFMLLLGGLAGRLRLPRNLPLGWVVCAAGGLGLLGMQRGLYPHTVHVERPWQASFNEYQQAFIWARDHTPADALFALDAAYTTAPGEDAHLFRAVALRSSLPDAAKDGGIAAVMPRLAPMWQAGARAQAGFAAATDAERLQRVGPLGATWMVLPTSAATHFDCPYTNRTAKVCRLP